MSALLERQAEVQPDHRMGLLPESEGLEQAFEAATRLIADAASRRDATSLTRLRDELRMTAAAWTLHDSAHYYSGCATQLLASATASLQRIPGPGVIDELRRKPRMRELLAHVQATGDASSQELIAGMGVDDAQVSRAGRRLTALGLLSRSQDGKHVWWEITDRGREVFRAVDAQDGRRRRTTGRTLSVDHAEALLRAAKDAARKSEAATATMVARHGAEFLAERVLLVRNVARFATAPPDCRFPDPEQSLQDRRHTVWQSLREVAPKREIDAFTENFWPTAAPHFDACAIVPGQDGRAGVVLIDARVSPDEFVEPPVKPQKVAHQQAVERAIKQTRQYLGVTRTRGWRHYRDPAQRLAFLFGLQEHLSAPIWMLNLYFVAQPSHSLLPAETPASIDEWWDHITPLRSAMELSQGHALQPSVAMDFLLEPQSSLSLEAVAARGDERPKARQHVVRSGTSWEVITHPGAPRPVVVTDTQADAILQATTRLRRGGGGELVIHKSDGTVRDTETIV